MMKTVGSKTSANPSCTGVGNAANAVAQELDLGTLQNVDGTPGGAYFEFDRGVVQMSTVTGQVDGVRIPDGDHYIPGNLAAVVVMDHMGKFESSEFVPNVDGHVYYHFANGTAEVNKERNEVVGVDFTPYSDTDAKASAA